MTAIKDGVEISDKMEIFNKFIVYFVSIGSNLAASISPPTSHLSLYLKNIYCNSFFLFMTDPLEIISIASKLKNKTSSGYDYCIPVDIMKSSIQYIAEPLSNIINCSLRTWIFPDLLKIAKVCPIYKNGDKKLFSNIRPISVLPSFSKIFENSLQ